MNTDRFRFRAWDNQRGKYTLVDPVVKCHENGVRELTMDDPERYVIEQCTGLRGKNGTLIFEGDVIFRPENGGRKFFVRKAKESPMFIFRPESDDESIIPSCRLSHLYEVIGNIHEVK